MRSRFTPPSGNVWPEPIQKALDRPNNAPTTSFVYFVYDAEGKRIKIGKSIDPLKRVKALQTSSGALLELAGSLAGNEALEGVIHKEFAADRIVGEWFRLTSRLVDLIGDAEAAGTRRRLPGGEKHRDELSSDVPRRHHGEETSAQIDALAQVLGITRSQALKYAKQIDRSIAGRRAAA